MVCVRVWLTPLPVTISRPTLFPADFFVAECRTVCIDAFTAGQWVVLLATDYKQ